MISFELKSAFKALDNEEKKNRISNELLAIGEIIKRIQLINNIESDFSVKNYDANNPLNREETLEFFYEDIVEIEKQLLKIMYSLKNDVE